MNTYRENLATKQGLKFEEIISQVNEEGTSLQLSIHPTNEAYKNSRLTFGVLNPVILNSMKMVNDNIEVTQYLVFASDDHEESMKELKKFQRQFKKSTGNSLLKNRFNHHTNEPIWTTYISIK